MEPVRILLVDDHGLFRSGIAQLIQAQTDFEVVGEACNGEEALEKAKELMPDVILMDVYMPVMGGLEATRRIKEILPYLKIVMLTISDQDSDLFEAIKAGAQGYLLKKMDTNDFFATLRGAFRGEAPISKMTAGKILQEFERVSRGETEEDSLGNKLSPRELEVLHSLTQGGTNKDIAKALFISENTVKNHLKNILEKLHLKNRVQAVAFALREGLTQKSDSQKPDPQ